MRVYVTPLGGEAGKFEGVVRAFPQAWGGTVIDIGCRSGRLRHALVGLERGYCGVDLCPPASVLGNLDAGLPFPNQSFDTAVALDVLEHTDGIHRSLAELCRVARHYVVVSLPNAYELRLRTKFALGKPISGKYGLPPEPVIDRHRWLFSLSDAGRFCAQWGRHCGFHVEAEGCLVGPRRAATISKLAIGALPDLLAPTYLVLLRRAT